MRERNSGALAGLRVVELGELVSAPYCGRLLAGLGAGVVKVETLPGGPARPPGPAPRASPAGPAGTRMGEPGRAPLPLPVSQPDYQGGVNAAIGFLLACLARERSGQGQHVGGAPPQGVAVYGGVPSPM